MAIECVNNHTIYLMDRGGQRRVNQLTRIGEVSWGRRRDDISESDITISSDSCALQEDTIKQMALGTGRWEIAIFRGDERVHEGPITRVNLSRAGAKVHSRDVMHYVQRTALRKVYNSQISPTVSESAVKRVKRILQGELARKEQLGYNILAHLQTLEFATDAKTRKVNKPYETNVWAHIDDMAAKGGIDYTVVGRRIVVWDTSKALGQTQTATEVDFLDEIGLTYYGMDLATSSTVTDGEGLWQTAGGEDPFYGQVDFISNPYDEEGSETPTAAELMAQAKRNLVGRNPTPFEVRVPENASINPQSRVLTMAALVPGNYIPLRATIHGIDVAQMLKLNAMKVNEKPSGETITAALVKATAADEDEVED